MRSATEAVGEAPKVDVIYDEVSSRFEVEEGLLEHGVPTFYVRLRPDAKDSFIRLMKALEPLDLIPILREVKGRAVLKVIHKPRTRPKGVLMSVISLLITLVTTYVAGHVLSTGLVRSVEEIGGVQYDLDPFVGALMFATAIIAVLGVHELGHKFMANKHKIEATLPYFIPGPPPPAGIGTFGAVIVQRSLAPSRDALFDVGASGPIAGFVIGVIVSAVGLSQSVVVSSPERLPGVLPVPQIFDIIARFALPPFEVKPGLYHYVLLHPIAFAGWASMIVTMLNLLPVGMLDGGHVARSLLKEKVFGIESRWILLVISTLILYLTKFWPMLIFLILFAFQRHPGPLNDVSGLSFKRKIVAAILMILFFLTLPIRIL